MKLNGWLESNCSSLAVGIFTFFRIKRSIRILLFHRKSWLIFCMKLHGSQLCKRSKGEKSRGINAFFCRKIGITYWLSSFFGRGWKCVKVIYLQKLIKAESYIWAATKWQVWFRPKINCSINLFVNIYLHTSYQIFFVALKNNN